MLNTRSTMTCHRQETGIKGCHSGSIQIHDGVKSLAWPSKGDKGQGGGSIQQVLVTEIRVSLVWSKLKKRNGKGKVGSTLGTSENGPSHLPFLFLF